MIELLVTLAVFLVISGAAFSLVAKHMPLFASQQNQATLNFGARNAAAQLQLDLANAGVGYYGAANMSTWPVGVTIKAGTGVNCHQDGTQAYAASCFDRLIILKFDTSTPIALVVGEGASNDQNTATSAELKVQPADPTKQNQSGNADLASHFAAGDYVMVVSADGKKMTIVKLTKVQASGNQVQLQHRQTDEYGVNSESDDIYGITTTLNGKLGSVYPRDSYVLRLAPAVYTVDATDTSNPKLVRLSAVDVGCSPVASDGTLAAPPYSDKCVITEQVIGFKVGASLVRETGDGLDPDGECQPYCYDSKKQYGNDWSVVRGIRVTLIGRTPPNTNPGANITNEFDHGPYKIEALSVVSNPRGLFLAPEVTVKQ